MTNEIIAGGAKALGIALPEGAPEKYREFIDALMEANREFNLTAIESAEDAARLHILDSLGLLNTMGQDAGSVIDVGTGGGLPGVALKIARPETDITLLDATEKKIDFLSELTAKLGIPCMCVAGRAEELGKEKEYREKYDCAVSRAVARLAVLCELCLPMVRVGGRFLAMKAADSDQEISEAKNAIETLGGKIRGVETYNIPGTDILRRVVVIDKVSATPEKYPRRWAAITKRTL